MGAFDETIQPEPYKPTKEEKAQDKLGLFCIRCGRPNAARCFICGECAVKGQYEGANEAINELQFWEDWDNIDAKNEAQIEEDIKRADEIADEQENAKENTEKTTEEAAQFEEEQQ